MPSVEQVQARGLGLLGLVSAIRPAFEDNQEVLPEPLWHYLSDDIDQEGWYPLEEYIEFVRALAGTMDKDKAKGDIYRALGVIAARRDVGGSHGETPENQRPEALGTYRDALSGVTGLATFVRRALRLRERYYSRGYYRVTRVPPLGLCITLNDFPLTRELCAISTGYLIELFRNQVPGTWVERTGCRAVGDPECIWSVRFDQKADLRGLELFE
ncbi:MAG: hypothetical protein OXR73_16215 [Myxococcales bacterium]|nr:hypothetical protein [Myxococcales bacterium]